MKTIKTLLILLSLSFATQADAQIWKKLGKKIEKAAEKTLEKKVEEKTEKETSKAFDSTFNNGSKNKNSKTKQNAPFNIGKSAATPASSYTFSHRYTMQINAGKQKTDLNYFLTNTGNYFGMNIPDDRNKSEMYTVMDLSKKSMYMFMSRKGDKTMMSMNLDFEETTNDAIEETNVNVTATGNTKNILGYNCQEFKIKGENIEGSVWVTQEAKVSFAKSMYNVKTKKGLNQSWMKLINGLTMEMDMVDTSKRKPQHITMTCIALEKQNFTIKTSDYKKLM